MISGLFRLHIVAVAALAAVAFGWIFDERFLLWAGAIAGLDWGLACLWNRASDVREDLLNEVEGAQMLARSGREFSRLALGVLSLSIFAALRLGWPLLVMRLAFHAGAFVYSYRIFRGRVKELLLAKNLFVALLWLLTSIGYPLALSRTAPRAGELLSLSVFVVPLAAAWTLLYDLRDVRGDAAAGLVTVPIALGVPRTRVVMELLLALSGAALLAGYLAGALRFEELVLVAAPLQQALLLRFWVRAAPSRHGTEAITWLCAGQLLSYIAWAGAGFPLPRF